MDDSFLKEAIRSVLEARDQIKAYREELFDPGGVLTSLSDSILGLKTTVESLDKSTSANLGLVHAEIRGIRTEMAGYGLRMTRVEDEVANLKQQLTTVILRLNRVEAPITTIKIPNGPIRILVVEDEHELREMLHTILRDEGMEVYSASDVESAKEKIDSLDVEVVLCDLLLPGASGADLVKFISDRTDRIIEIIIMSASGDVNNLIETLTLGAYSYVVKPFRSVTEISLTIQRAAEKRRLRVLRDRILSETATPPETTGKS